MNSTSLINKVRSGFDDWQIVVDSEDEFEMIDYPDSQKQNDVPASPNSEERFNHLPAHPQVLSLYHEPEQMHSSIGAELNPSKDQRQPKCQIHEYPSGGESIICHDNKKVRFECCECQVQ